MTALQKEITVLSKDLPDRSARKVINYIIMLKREDTAPEREPEFGSEEALDSLMELAGSISLPEDFEKEKDAYMREKYGYPD